MNLVAATLRSGSVYGVSENALQLRHRLDGGGRRGMMLCHGSAPGGNGTLQWVPLQSAFSPSIVVCPLLESVSALATETGGGTTWFNDTAMSAIDAAVDWLRGSQGGSQKIVGMGWSMGGGNLLEYAYRHPTKLAGLILGAPATDLDWFHTNPSFSAAVDAAYGGNYAANAVGHKPLGHAASLTLPLRLVHATDDATIPIQQSRDYFALYGGSDKQMTETTGDHSGFWGGFDTVELEDWIVGLPT